MMGFDRLTDSNFMVYAMKSYQNPHCMDIHEFEEDLKKTKYIKRLLNRYKTRGELKEQLIINHIVVLYNMFGIEAATKILFYKLDAEFRPQLKTFLTYLNFMPETISGVDDKIIKSSEIPLDITIVEALRHFHERANYN